jgi:hypothetical protein
LKNQDYVRSVAKTLAAADEVMRDASDKEKVIAVFGQIEYWLNFPQLERLGEVVARALVECHPDNQYIRDAAALYFFGIGRPVDGRAIGRGAAIEDVEVWSNDDKLKRSIAVGKFGVELKEAMDLAVKLAEKNKDSK